MGYFQLLYRNPRTLGFGLLNSFFSGLGQTHFIALFSPYLMATYALSNTEYGSIYSLVTLASGLTLPFAGPLIDKKDVRYFCVTIGVGLIFCELFLSQFEHIYLLIVALFGLRFFGQGLASHVSGITIARYFEEDRGKALSLTQLGYPLYEGLITPLFGILLVSFHWQDLSLTLIAALIIIYLPCTFLLTRNIPEFNKPFPENQSQISTEILETTKHWTRRQVFSSPTIYFILLHSLMPPFALTGLFFHQVTIGQFNQWSLSLMASAFVFFAVGRLITTFTTGPWVDRFKARTLFPFYQIPLTLGFLILSLSASDWVPALCFMLFGFSVGAGSPIKSAIWAELYGTKHLGSIKSSLATLMVISTAISPALFGWTLDKFGSPNLLLHTLFGFSVLGAGLSYIGLKRHSV